MNAAPRAIAASALVASAAAGACADLAGGDEVERSVTQIVCDCHGKVPGVEAFADDCEEQAGRNLAAADESARADYLEFFEKNSCGEARLCADVLGECLDHPAVCASTGEACSTSAICCGRSGGAGCCHEGGSPVCCASCVTCASILRAVRGELESVSSSVGCAEARAKAVALARYEKDVCVESIKAFEQLRACVAGIVEEGVCRSVCACADGNFDAARCAACVEDNCGPSACKGELP